MKKLPQDNDPFNTKIDVKPEAPVQSKAVSSSPKPRKPRVRLAGIHQDINLHLNRLKNDLRTY